MLEPGQGAELEFDAQHPDLDTKTDQVRSRYYVVGRKIYHLLAVAPIGEPFPPMRITGSNHSA